MKIYQSVNKISYVGSSVKQGLTQKLIVTHEKHAETVGTLTQLSSSRCLSNTDLIVSYEMSFGRVLFNFVLHFLY